MKHFSQSSKQFFSTTGRAAIASCVIAAGVCSADVIEVDGEHYVRTDRYTMVSIDAKPEQMSPLLSVVDIQFSNHIQTLGGALNELLEGSGYRWDMKAEHNTALGQLPLPMVVRHIGPVRLRDALITMAGSAWHLNVDEINRTIWFEPVVRATRSDHRDPATQQPAE